MPQMFSFLPTPDTPDILDIHEPPPRLNQIPCSGTENLMNSLLRSVHDGIQAPEAWISSNYAFRKIGSGDIQFPEDWI
jgi:hypothetical protein